MGISYRTYLVEGWYTEDRKSVLDYCEEKGIWTEDLPLGRDQDIIDTDPMCGRTGYVVGNVRASLAEYDSGIHKIEKTYDPMVVKPDFGRGWEYGIYLALVAS